MGEYMQSLFLHRGYIVAELDRGEGMKFHPCCGIPFVENDVPSFWYDQYEHVYWYTPIVDVSWFCDYIYGDRIDLPRISDRKPHAQGDVYPAHWTFDPYTGTPLGPWKFHVYLGKIVSAVLAHGRFLVWELN